MTRKTPLSQSADPILFPIAALLAIAIFAVDTLSPLGMAVAVLYVVVVLLSVSLFRWRGVLLVSLGCALLAILSYWLAHGVSLSGAHFVRLLVSLAAIGITAFLALKNRSAVADLSEQARLLDLTHDSIFVRDMEDVRTYWNKGSEKLYGWPADHAVGKVAHQLLQTVFSAPLEKINSELLRAGRWEGELVHATREGTWVVAASRWSLCSCSWKRRRLADCSWLDRYREHH